MRIGTFNVENLFSRVKAMNLDSWDEGGRILDDVSDLDRILSKAQYEAADKDQIKALLEKYGFNDPRKEDRPFQIVEVRGKLFSVRRGEIEVRANGRADWLGWVEWARDTVNSQAVENTARVIAAVSADILCLVEVESRMTLGTFNRQVISKFMAPYGHNMRIDGNDPRRINIGLLSRRPIVSVRSHIDDVNGGNTRIFSRDCPEFEIAGRSGWPSGRGHKANRT